MRQFSPSAYSALLTVIRGAGTIVSDVRQASLHWIRVPATDVDCCPWQAAWITFKDSKDADVLAELTKFDPDAEEALVEKAVEDMDALGLEVRRRRWLSAEGITPPEGRK